MRETGAGLVEYSPLILICSCLLFSLYQVLFEGHQEFLLAIAAIVLLVLSLIGYSYLQDSRAKQKKDKP